MVEVYETNAGTYRAFVGKFSGNWYAIIRHGDMITALTFMLNSSPSRYGDGIIARSYKIHKSTGRIDTGMTSNTPLMPLLPNTRKVGFITLIDSRMLIHVGKPTRLRHAIMEFMRLIPKTTYIPDNVEERTITLHTITRLLQCGDVGCVQYSRINMMYEFWEKQFKYKSTVEYNVYGIVAGEKRELEEFHQSLLEDLEDVARIFNYYTIIKSINVYMIPSLYSTSEDIILVWKEGKHVVLSNVSGRTEYTGVIDEDDGVIVVLESTSDTTITDRYNDLAIVRNKLYTFKVPSETYVVGVVETPKPLNQHPGAKILRFTTPDEKVVIEEATVTVGEGAKVSRISNPSLTRDRIAVIGSIEWVEDLNIKNVKDNATIRLEREGITRLARIAGDKYVRYIYEVIWHTISSMLHDSNRVSYSSPIVNSKHENRVEIEIPVRHEDKEGKVKYTISVENKGTEVQIKHTLDTTAAPGIEPVYIQVLHPPTPAKLTSIVSMGVLKPLTETGLPEDVHRGVATLSSGVIALKLMHDSKRVTIS